MLIFATTLGAGLAVASLQAVLYRPVTRRW